MLKFVFMVKYGSAHRGGDATILSASQIITVDILLRKSHAMHGCIFHVR